MKKNIQNYRSSMGLRKLRTANFGKYTKKRQVLIEKSAKQRVL